MLEESTGTDVGRRELLRRGALLGGTLLWATPVVQSIAPSAFASEGSPRACHDISYIAVVATRTSDGQKWQFKAEAGGSIETGKRMQAPHCAAPAGWNDPHTVGGLPPGMTAADIDRTDPCCWAVRLPAGFTLFGVAMGAGGDKTDQGYCVDNPTISNGGTVYTLCAPAR